jgi:hypothetical protein
MGLFAGLPDFGARLPFDACELYGPFEPGPHLLFPTELAVKLREPGKPDLELVFVRASGTGPDYGVLDFGIERHQPTGDALTWLRDRQPAATLDLVPFEAGFVRLVAGPEIVNVPPDLLRPAPLAFGGVDQARYNLRLSADGAALLKAGLQNTLLLTVRAELEVRGVAPRVQSTAVFDPAALLAALVPAGASRQLPSTVLDDFFRAAPTTLPLKLEGDPAPDREAFALAMAGRVRTAFGKFVPSPTAAGPCFVELADAPHGTFRWDLSEPLVVPRTWVFTLDPFTAARELARAAGLDAVYREVTVAPLKLGFFDVDVQALLPGPRTGLVDLGVSLTAPPKLPFRPQAQTQLLSLPPPDDHAVAHFKLAPMEKPGYLYKTYAAVSEGAAIRRLDGAEVSSSAPTLVVQLADFPIDLVEVSAEAALLAVGSPSGALGYTAPSGAQVSTPFQLTTEKPRCALALPRDATSATLSLEVQPLTGGGSPLHLGPLPARGQHFTLASFAEYGPHQVALTGSFPSGAPGPLQVDLLADGLPELPANLATLFLTRDSPAASWSYQATSPFHAGYRYRLHGAAAWSAPQPPGAPLALTAAPGPAARATSFDLRGVHLYTLPADPPGRVHYLPAAPAPLPGDQGQPALQVTTAGDGTGQLTLACRFDLSDAQRADLEVDLLERLAAVDRVDFQPAPFTVSGATLWLTDAAGKSTQLAAASAGAAAPFAASFTASLDAAGCARAQAALAGATSALRVDYALALGPELSATLDGAPTALVRSADLGSWSVGAGAGTGHG